MYIIQPQNRFKFLIYASLEAVNCPTKSLQQPYEGRGKHLTLCVCLIYKMGHTTNHSAAQSSEPTPKPYSPGYYLSYKSKKRKNLSWVPSVCMFFSILSKSVPSQALLFSIWLNSFHVQIISSLGKLCHQEAINNMSFVPTSFPWPVP